MMLIGQYDSPFVRRVGLALAFYELPFDHRPWSVFGDLDKIAPFNPLRRVPTLVLDDGEVLIDSAAILDHLDEAVGPKRALIAESGPVRRATLKTIALGTGLADKAVALVYERALHDKVSPAWIDRCRLQIKSVLDALEKDRAARASCFWFGDGIGHADIAVASALRFLREAHPALFDAARWPKLAAHAAASEALPPFQKILQVFTPPS